MANLKKIVYFGSVAILYLLVITLILGLSFVLNSYVNRGKIIYAPQQQNTQTKKAISEI